MPRVTPKFMNTGFAACSTAAELMTEIESASEVLALLPRFTRDGRSVLPGDPGYDEA